MADQRGIKAGRAFVELYTEDKEFIKRLKQAQQRVRHFGMAVQATGLKMMAAGAAIVAPLLASAKVFASMGDSLAKMSRRTGISVEALSELAYASDRSGTSMEDLEKGVKRMQRTIYDAGRGLSTATEALADLGLSMADLRGLSPEQQFKLIADRLAQVGDATTKAALAQELFGRSGTALLPMIEKGAAGIEELQESARRLGLTISTEDARAAEVFQDTLTDLWRVLKNVVFTVGASLAPLLTGMAHWVQDIAQKVKEWVNNNRELIVTVFKAGASLLVMGGIVVGVAKIILTLGTAMRLLTVSMGPVGWVVAGATVALAALAGLKTWKVLSDAGDDVHRLRVEMDKLGEPSLGIIEELTALREGRQRLREEQRKLQELRDSLAAAENPGLNDIEEGLAALDQAEAKVAALRAEVERLHQAAVDARNKQANVNKLRLDAEWARKAHQAKLELIEDEHTRELALINERYNYEREQADITTDAIISIEKVRAAEIQKLDRETAKKRSEETRRANEENRGTIADLKYDIAKLKIEQMPEGPEKVMAGLRLEYQRELKALQAAGMGSAVGFLNEKYNLLAQQALGGLQSAQVSVAGTFNPMATWGMGATSPAERTAKATEETARLLRQAAAGRGMVFA